MQVSILLADDHIVVRQGLRSFLEGRQHNVVAEASDGWEAVRLARELQPQVAVLDFAMPSLNGVDATKEIAQVSPKTRSILLTMHSEDHYVLQALQAGAKGYVLKSRTADDLVAAIKEISQGHTYLSPSVCQTLVSAYLDQTVIPDDPLSSREREVVQLIAEGKTSKELAAQLGISTKTAESHRARIMEKLDIHDIAGLVRYAIRRGIIQP